MHCLKRSNTCRDPEALVVEDEKNQINVAVIVDAHTEDYQDYLTLREDFSSEKEQRLNRKIDWHILPPLMLIYMLTYVDRSNVGNAKLFGAQKDLGMKGTDWNIGLSLLFITFAIGAPFSAALGKKYTTRFKLPLLLAACGATILAAGCSNNKAAWYAFRLILGLFESGVPSISAYILSTWYSSDIFTSRYSWFYFGATISGAVSGLLAYGIAQLDYHWGYKGWRWIYVLEGFASIIIAILLCFVIPGTTERTHKWITSEEQRFILLRGRYTYGTDKSGNSSEFKLKEYLSAWTSPHLLIPGFSFFSFPVGIFAFSFTLPTIIASMGFTAAAEQGLSAPPYVAATFAVGFTGWASDRYKTRILTVVGPAFVAVVGLAMMWASVGKKNLVGVCYTGCMLAAMGFYPLSPTHTSILALNNAGQSKRSAALGGLLVFTQVGGVLGSNIYLSSQAPYYPVGFGVSAGLVIFGNLIVMTGYWFYVGAVNKKRAAMSEEEIRAEYTSDELEEMGDKAPLYIYSR
ncbi:uncharacterized protein I206_103746 [Kwoniella pini CBS 10737]|uniref:Major facilitator superfamily (MFS) profile domain-containing protein n=1 Tax=Kwoniella pini CBS 10737 TaxID=1296096 RepID=A0A1B9I974_9TREE|nr:uncharacterized protein I206_01255 [Kwoniella pini CBS 10737]OCF51971.1 hypothetical protein I206_01255 [Kwoniella pini CBS 10737]